MAGPYLFPPVGGFGNPASPWNYTTASFYVDLQAHQGKALLLKVEVKDTVNVGQTVTLYPGATVARSSSAGDRPSNTWINDALETSVNFGRQLFQGADPRANATTTEGVIELTDPGTDLEYLYDYSWDSAPLTIYRGDENDLFSTYGQVAKFTSALIIGDMEKKTIRTRDLGWKLGGLIHDERYAGTGGLEGGESNKGKWKPYAVGYVFNVEPVAIDSANEVFQWSFTPSQTVVAVKHGGVPITVSADYPTYAALIAASIPLGQCATCKAKSLVRTNFSIEFGIRVDAVGDSNVVFGHGTPLNRAEVALRIATGYGESKLEEATDVDVTAFADVGQDHPGDVGFWWGDETSKADALNEIMAGILGYWHVRPNGQLSIGFIEEPDSIPSISDIEFGDYGMSEIEIVDETIPYPSTLMTWRRNYAPQSRDQLAGSVSVDEATASVLAAAYSVAVSTDATVSQLYPTASPIAISGNFRYEEDALNEANRIQDLMGVPRRRYRMNLEIDPFADIINRVATFKNFNRMRLGDSKNLICVSVDSVGFGPLTTEWWG